MKLAAISDREGPCCLCKFATRGSQQIWSLVRTIPVGMAYTRKRLPARKRKREESYREFATRLNDFFTKWVLPKEKTMQERGVPRYSDGATDKTDAQGRLDLAVEEEASEASALAVDYATAMKPTLTEQVSRKCWRPRWYENKNQERQMDPRSQWIQESRLVHMHMTLSRVKSRHHQGGKAVKSLERQATSRHSHQVSQRNHPATRVLDCRRVHRF